jgi:hypothetical protein
MRPLLTIHQSEALKWLKEHGGDGCFDIYGVLLAQGETAPVSRRTWNRLRDMGFVEMYGGKVQGGHGRGRMRLTPGPVDA